MLQTGYFTLWAGLKTLRSFPWYSSVYVSYGGDLHSTIKSKHLVDISQADSSIS